MSEKVEFKVGDLVYYPNISNKIGKIVGVSIIANDPYCLKVAIDDTAIFVTKDGKFAVNAPIPVIYHATKENYEWLSATFPNVAFEPPPKEVVMSKKQAIEKYKDTPLYFDHYNKNSFYFKSDSEKISVTCSPCYMYDFEVCNKETIGDLLNYLDNDEISIWIDGKEILENENE